MVSIVRVSKGNQPYRIELRTEPLANVANHERPMPDRFIAKSGMDVTKAFMNYVSPLIGELPVYQSLPR